MSIKASPRKTKSVGVDNSSEKGAEQANSVSHKGDVRESIYIDKCGDDLSDISQLELLQGEVRMSEFHLRTLEIEEKVQRAKERL